MPMRANDLETLLRSAFPDAKIELQDLAGDDDHYALTLISPLFKGKTRVQQHQMVYAALQGKMMNGQLHALALTTRAD